MKKSTAKDSEKNNDKIRLECLTKEPQGDIWSYGKKVFPEHVCGYGLGIYYEINFRKKSILIEFYKEGYCYQQYEEKYTRFLNKK